MAEQRGLLGRIGGGIQGLLGNPVVQGLGVAAGAGFNPALGLLAVPALSGIRQGIADDNEQRRQRIRQQQALNRLPGLLRDTSVVQGQGGQMPLESVSGPAEQIQIPGRKAQVQTINTPQGRGELQGVLAEAAPGAVAGLLAEQVFSPQQQQQGRLGEQLSAFAQVLGRQPTEQEFLQLVGAAEDSGQNIDDILKRLQVEQILDEREREREERDAASREERETFRDRSSNALAVAQANQVLTGTPLEPGSTALDLRRSGSSFGREVLEGLGFQTFLGTPLSEVKNREVAFDIFEKGSAAFARNLTSDLERGTNLQFNNLKDSIPNLGISPEANAFILEPFVVEALKQDAADNGFQLENRAEFEQALQSLRQQQAQFRAQFGGAQNTFPSVEAVEAAVNSGQISIGDTVVVDGQEFVVSAD